MSEAEKGYEVSGCFGVDSCPNAITASIHLLSSLEKILEEEKLIQFLTSKVGPRLKAHHKFKVCLFLSTQTPALMSISAILLFTGW